MAEILTNRGFPASREIRKEELMKGSWQRRAVEAGYMRFYEGVIPAARAMRDETGAIVEQLTESPAPVLEAES